MGSSVPSPRRPLRPGVGIVLLLLVVGVGPKTARGQGGPDAVERLRRALRTQWPDASTRDAGVKACVGALRGLGELRRALLLGEWRPSGTDGQADALGRDLVAERFLLEVRAALQRGDAVTAGVVLDMVAETATELRNQGDTAGIVRSLGPDLVALTRRSDARLRAAVARVLGQIGADVTVSVPALAELLQAREPAVRRSAVEGLADLLDTARAALDHHGADPAGTDRADVLRTAAAVVSAVGGALEDPSPEVRRTAAAALGKAAALAARLVSDPPPAAQLQTAEAKQLWWQAVQDVRAGVRPLLAALSEQTTALVRVLGRGAGEERLAVYKALEEMANVRYRWLRQSAGTGQGDDPMLDAFRGALAALAGATADPDARLRRAALAVLETVGPAAAPAAPALAAALGDGDRFVRWTAVRALRNIGPAAARCATPGLARLLEDPDVDVRLAAAGALQQFAPCCQTAGVCQASYAPGQLSAFARTALPPLVRALRSDDREVRTAALRTLRGLGPEARPAVPALREALADGNPRVRQTAAETLGAVGPEAHPAVDDLRRATQDPDAAVRRAVAAALLNILRGQ